jgi:antitoxin FitA
MRGRMLECICACYRGEVAKTVQIRDLDDEVYAGLARRAAEEGVSVPELLRAEATRLASRPSMGAWLERTRRRSSSIDRAAVTAALDEQRGEWPDARR